MFVVLPLVVSNWSQVYGTDIGEQRSVTLADGSMAYLSGNSRLEVRLSEHSREVDLIAGAAWFAVQPDASRPFRVITADGLIEATSTEFGVDQEPEGTKVSVLEGRVLVLAGWKPRQATPVRSQDMVAGEEARIVRTGTVRKNAASDATTFGAWRRGQLIFDGDALAVICAKFNRHNRSPQLQTTGSVSKLRYSGKYAMNDPMSFVRALELDPQLVVEHVEDRITIRARADVEATAVR
jgi:transmembrane sensor